MHRSAVSIAPTLGPGVGGSPINARLALAELLLASGELHTSARQCVDWLARHTGVRRALVATVDLPSPVLRIVAEHGMSSASIADAEIGRDETAHPLIVAMERDEPTYFARTSGVTASPGVMLPGVIPQIEWTGFHAIPLRSDGETCARGILLAASFRPEIDPDVVWVSRQLSRQLARLFPGRDQPGIRFGPEPKRELEQASSLKFQFLANISHEFRTPLNAILGYTHLLLQGVTGEVTEPQRKSLTRIDSNSRHLLSLINDILDITRIEAGRMPLHVTSVRIPDLVDEVMSELEPTIRLSTVAVAARMSRTLPALRTDRQKVKQIVLNLLSNALKFTPAGSVTIEVGLESKGRMVTIAVRDTGVGIPEESREVIFEDFRQLDGSPTRGFGGTGLGLSICRRLAEMLGGSIDLESHVGEGSTFTLRLPVRARPR